MEGDTSMGNVASGSPTKGFFVSMLTRDIELNDAIMDLLDNCLDGVVRQKGLGEKRDAPGFYNGYYSKITVSSDRFIIEDNCGGIPRTVAENYAFRMGRNPDYVEDALPTVGIYGIGMKRAIFKIGQSATVVTRDSSDFYQVDILPDWASTSDWDFPITDLSDEGVLPSRGTFISIGDINPEIQQLWNSLDKLSSFVDNLKKSIQQCYSFIIKKGFSIEINGEIIEALPMNILVDESDKKESIKPFLYRQDFDDVSVYLAVGFYAPPPSPDEIDDENTMKRTTADAGWTVVCNDRVVLYNDKSHLTGWGEAGVPQYHTQFIVIRGIVVFVSNNPNNLPMTTTKRGIDTSSPIYAVVKDKMRQGLKMFTDYTNRWKGRNETEREHSQDASSISIDSLLGPKTEVESITKMKFHPAKSGEIINPNLPSPPNDKPYRRISFNRGIDDIEDIIEFFFKDRTHAITPSAVGEKCFDETLIMAHKSKEGK